MTDRPSIDVAERRRRLVTRLHVGVPAATVDEAIADMVVLHATDPAALFLQLWARLPGLSLADLEAELEDRRSFVRVLSMRRTLFGARTADAGRVSAAAAPKVAAGIRRQLLVSLAANDLDEALDLDRIAEDTLAALAAHPDGLSTRACKDLVPALATTFELKPGSKWSTTASLASRLLYLLSAEGRIVRGHTLGGWLGTQYHWVLPGDWSSDLDLGGVDEDEASHWLVTRWLARFGPGTFTDLLWWTGWTKTRLRGVLADVAPTEVDLPGSFGAGAHDPEPGLVLAGDVGSTPAPERPAVALLPMLDAVPMGWKRRAWYAPDDAVDRLWDSMGNVGATVWVDGTIVGAWGLQEGRVTLRVLADVDGDAMGAVRDEAGRLERWLDGRTFTARFPSPLQRELSGG